MKIDSIPGNSDGTAFSIMYVIEGAISSMITAAPCKLIVVYDKVGQMSDNYS